MVLNRMRLFWAKAAKENDFFLMNGWVGPLGWMRSALVGTKMGFFKTAERPGVPYGNTM